MTKRLDRRTFLRGAGFVIALPMLECMLPATAAAAGTQRKRFIGAFAPNGAYMPLAANGNWTWTEALKPLADSGHKGNVAVMRGLTKVSPADLHWNNTAGFLSAKQIVLNPLQPTCGQSLDQMVAAKVAMPVHSLQVGWRDQTWSGSHYEYSDRYLNTISWRTDGQPLSKINSPPDLFNRIFAAKGASEAHLKYLQTKNKSILDAVLGQMQSLTSRVPAADKRRLDSYFDSVREIEKSMRGMPACQSTEAVPVFDPAYGDHFKLMHRLIATAFRCDLTNAATIMYDTGVGDPNLVHETSGISEPHHSYAHYAGHANHGFAVARLKAINAIHTALFADLLTELKKTPGLLEETLLIYGSNMSDGNLHRENNLPILVAGAGTDLRFGEEVGTKEAEKPFANLLAEASGLLGLSVSKFGDGANASTSSSVGLVK